MSKTDAPLLTFQPRIQGYFKTFKAELDLSERYMTIEQIEQVITMLEARGWKGTTFEKKEPAADLNGKTGTVEKIEKSKTRNGKDCFLASIKVEGRDDPVAVMFFKPGEVRKGDSVKLVLKDGYVNMELIDEDGEAIPF